STIGRSFPSKRKARIKNLPGPLTENTLKGVAEYISSGQCKNVIILTGAGISTSAGIPDFRSPDTGLYANFDKFGVPSSDSMFDIDYFRINPKAFYGICKSFMDVLKQATPTLSHYFLKLLAEKKILLRLYTQNIDGMEREVGIDPKYIIEAHGSLSISSCINCRAKIDIELFKNSVLANTILYCPACNGLVKPDVVFFGERLPDYFFESVEHDCKNCDLLIVSGTSLHVYPISLIVQLIPPDVPRLLINDVVIEPFIENSSTHGSETSSIVDKKEPCDTLTIIENPVDKISLHDDATNDTPECMELTTYDRDVVWVGNTDDGFRELATHLGWNEELQTIMDLANRT
ncbi:hypothetical protein MXB_5427, partial [Myxobolus squamalis]